MKPQDIHKHTQTHTGAVKQRISRRPLHLSQLTGPPFTPHPCALVEAAAEAVASVVTD